MAHSLMVMVPTIDGVPVLLPAHEHPEFGTPGMHYHVDFNYCTDEPRQDRVIHSNEKPVMVSFQIHRNGYLIVSANIKLVLWLANKYKNCVAKNGVCPHKGLPIYGGICTGHGMAFDKDGVVAQHYYLRVAGVLLPIHAKNWDTNIYTIEIDRAIHATGIELITVDERVISRIAFAQPINACSGDQLKVTVS